ASAARHRPVWAVIRAAWGVIGPDLSASRCLEAGGREGQSGGRRDHRGWGIRPDVRAHMLVAANDRDGCIAGDYGPGIVFGSISSRRGRCVVKRVTTSPGRAQPLRSHRRVAWMPTRKPHMEGI